MPEDSPIPRNKWIEDFKAWHDAKYPGVRYLTCS
jgi:hypothetical protein